MIRSHFKMPLVRSNALFCVAILVLAVTGFSQTPPPTDPNLADKFEMLCAKLKAGDTSIDFKALRLASVMSKAVDSGPANRDTGRRIRNAYRAGDYAGTVEEGEKALKASYLDLETHNLIGEAYRQLGNTQKFEFHRAVYLGLLNSILVDATGLSDATAYHIVMQGEASAVLNALDLHGGTASIRVLGAHRYHVYKASSMKPGSNREVWFNVDLVLKESS